ncbi:MAG: hypothetical protein Q9191_007007, partial [Dirinaria sp. TL-2023a]
SEPPRRHAIEIYDQDDLQAAMGTLDTLLEPQDEFNDVFKGARIGDVRQIEPIYIGHFHPSLQFVDDGFWAAYDVRHHTA